MTAPLCSVPRSLTIAGSDSGAGAGIQADLKTFAALGVYGASALTAVTAQNTRSVHRVEELSVAMVAAQIDAVLEDIGADAVKTGMLASAPIIAVVAARLRQHTVRALVVDPVMVAKGGDRLLREDAVAVLCRELLPLALVVTPNIPEAEVLAGVTITGDQDTLAAAARRIAAYGPRYVLMKGGAPPWGAGGRPSLGCLYSALRAVCRSAHRHDQHPRHRLHSLGSHRCWSGPGPGCTGHRGRRTGVHRGRHWAGATDRPWPWTATPLLGDESPAGCVDRWEPTIAHTGVPPDAGVVIHGVSQPAATVSCVCGCPGCFNAGMRSNRAPPNHPQGWRDSAPLAKDETSLCTASRT